MIDLTKKICKYHRIKKKIGLTFSHPLGGAQFGWYTSRHLEKFLEVSQT